MPYLLRFFSNLYVWNRAVSILYDGSRDTVWLRSFWKISGSRLHQQFPHRMISLQWTTMSEAFPGSNFHSWPQWQDFKSQAFIWDSEVESHGTKFMYIAKPGLKWPGTSPLSQASRLKFILHWTLRSSKSCEWVFSIDNEQKRAICEWDPRSRWI